LTLKQHIEQTLGSGTIEQAVKLPRGEDTNEWVAVNTVFFYNALNVLYTVLDGSLCTDERCPVMSAGPQFEYLWADGARVKTPIKLSAPDYINSLFDWVEEQLDDPSLFPRGLGGGFPRDFLAVVKTILKRLFRVYAHLYHSHFRQITMLELEPHLNTCFRHFILFIQASVWRCLFRCVELFLLASQAGSCCAPKIPMQEFDLVDEKELAPMRELIERILRASK
jgi:MOB kinase activator 1